MLCVPENTHDATVHVDKTPQLQVYHFEGDKKYISATHLHSRVFWHTCCVQFDLVFVSLSCIQFLTFISILLILVSLQTHSRVLKESNEHLCVSVCEIAKFSVI